MGSVSGVESPYRLIVRVSAQIVALRTRREMNFVKTVFLVLNAIHMEFAIDVVKILFYLVKNYARRAMNSA